MSEIVRIRGSSWGTLFDCAYKWEGTYILGMTKPSSGRAHLGTSIHRSTAEIDIRRMEGHPMTFEEANDVFIDAMDNPEHDVDWKHDNLAIQDAKYIGTCLNDHYLKDWSPRFNFLAIEKEINDLDIETDEGVTIRLTGKMDRSRIITNLQSECLERGLDSAKMKISSRKGILDIKTGKAAVQKGVAKTKGHAAQLAVYELLEEEQSGEPCTAPAEILGMQTSTKPKIALGSIENPKRLMLGDDQNEGMISMAAKMLKSGLFTPNPTSMLCDERYCARYESCIYHG